VSKPPPPADSGEPRAATPEFPIVREATRDDAALLHRLAAATFALACPPGTLQSSIDEFIATMLSAEAFAGYLSDPERELFVAEVGGDPAGYTMVVYGEPTDAEVAASVTSRPTAELSKMYVLERFHGVGVASALIEASADAARKRGSVSMWLGVNEQNAKANRFYEKSGFAIVGHKTFLLGGKYEDDHTRALEL
jgi:GNAT superfamily N-acetyltransferase